MTTSHNTATTGPLRRLFSGCYDWLLIVALCMVASLPVVAWYGEPIPAGNPFYQLSLVLISITYFTYCWRRSGQTPGMKTWYLKLESVDGSAPSLKQCMQRLLAAGVSTACLGVGFWWAWTNPERLTWHDQWSNTRLKRMPKRGKGLSGTN